MAHKSQDQKPRKIQFQTPKIIKIIIWGVIGFLVALMVGWQFISWWRLETAKAAAVALQPQAAVKAVKIVEIFIFPGEEKDFEVPDDYWFRVKSNDMVKPTTWNGKEIKDGWMEDNILSRPFAV